MTIRNTLKRVLPVGVLYLYRFIRYPDDAKSVCRFLVSNISHVTMRQKLKLIHSMYKISAVLEAPHTQAEILAFIREILSLPSDSEGVVVEAGCFKGASTAKFSLAARIAGRKLVVFDSFQGIPEHDEDHRESIFGKPVSFAHGSYHGKLDEVRTNVARFGHIGSCEFHEGWFKDTMANHREPVATAYLDVDLAESTYTCLRYLYPRLNVGGSIFSQDGHLPLVVDVFRDESFWRDELGVDTPFVEGLGKHKLIRLVKPGSST